MTVLGIDPGLANIGWGVIDSKDQKFHLIDYGHLTTKAHTPVEDRIQRIGKECSNLLDTHKIDALGIEDIFYFQNKSSAISVAKVIGAIYYVASLHEVPVFSYSPLQIKTSITGFGRADKKQVQEMVKILLGLPKIPKPDHAADALATAICHCTQSLAKERIGI